MCYYNYVAYLFPPVLRCVAHKLTVKFQEELAVTCSYIEISELSRPSKMAMHLLLYMLNTN